MSPFSDDAQLVDDLPPATADDKEMALAFQRGDAEAYRAIHDRYEERVQRVCRRMLGKREDAQEAAQETFIRVYTALGKFNGRYQLGAWITRIATNVCLDQIRARSRRPVDAAPIEDLELELQSSGGDADPESVTVRRAESRRVRKVLLGLPPTHRAAIVLRDYEGLSYADVAIALGMTECQVKALLHRARKGFRRSWTPLVEMLVPAKLLQRFREADVSVKEQVVNAASSHAAPLASVCSGALQQCGTFVVQKVGPVMAATVLGGAAFASPALRAQPELPAPVATALAGGAAAPAPDAPERSHDRVAAPPEAPPATSGPAAPATAAPSAPPPSPSASPSAEPEESPPPSASPSPASGAATNPKMAPSPTPTPTPAPFLPVFHFDTGHTPTGRAPASNSTTVDCSTRSVDQTMRATISDHEGVYPIDVRMKASSNLQMEFTVYKKGFAVYYSGGGVLVAQSNSGNQYRLTFNGRYGSGGTAADSAGLPVNGSLRVELALDCTAQSLVAESVVLATQ